MSENNSNDPGTRAFHVYMEPLKAVTTARPVSPPARRPEQSEDMP